MKDLHSSTNKIIGQNLKTLRQLKGLTQGQLGHIVGVSFQQIQKYEAGDNTVSAVKLYQLAQALGTNISEIFGEEDVQSTNFLASMKNEMKEGGGYRELHDAFTNIKSKEKRQAALQIVQALASNN